MGAPNIGYNSGRLGPLPTRTYTSGSTLQINGGSAISAGQIFTGSLTFTGLLTTDEFAIYSTKAQMDAINAVGVSVLSARCTAANTVVVEFAASKAVPAASIPAAASWYCTVIAPMIVGTNLA